MSSPVTAQSVLDRNMFALSQHLTAHGASLRVQGLPPPQIDCPTCLAVWAAVEEARALVEAAAVVPLPSSVVPPTGRTRR